VLGLVFHCLYFDIEIGFQTLFFGPDLTLVIILSLTCSRILTFLSLILLLRSVHFKIHGMLPFKCTGVNTLFPCTIQWDHFCFIDSKLIFSLLLFFNTNLCIFISFMHYRIATWIMTTCYIYRVHVKEDVLLENESWWYNVRRKFPEGKSTPAEHHRWQQESVLTLFLKNLIQTPETSLQTPETSLHTPKTSLQTLKTS
jgi:hypothetical protein